MRIDSTRFCQLATADRFLTWLHQIDPPKHEALMAHLRKAEGCNSNREKMITLLDDLLAVPAQADALEKFIRKYYPAIINERPVIRTADHRAKNVHGVFKHYDPSLMTYPQRYIITKLEAGSQQMSLDDAVASFCANRPICEHVIVEDRAYVEYLPDTHAHLADELSDESWQVRKYKRKRHKK